MTKYYKKYELSLSLNGNDVMHIARNASGIVVFREPSEKALKDAIDSSIQEEIRTLEESQSKPKKTKKVVKLLSDEDESVLTPPTQQRVTRGPDGKFISKSALSEEDETKKGFWEKLTS